MKKILFLLVAFLLAAPPAWSQRGIPGEAPSTLAADDFVVLDLRGSSVLTVVTVPDAAIGTLTGSGQPLDTETATIGATVYTGETGALDADYKFKIGASLTLTLQALCACINGDDDGVVCDAGTAAHPTVTCTGSTATTLTIEAITAGSGANTIATTETLTTNAWGAATLVDVVDPIVTVSRVDSIEATEHGVLSTAITDTVPKVEIVNVDWPYLAVSSSGNARYVVMRLP